MRYWVECADRYTGKDVSHEVNAINPGEAERKAAALGYLVTSVRLVGVPPLNAGPLPKENPDTSRKSRESANAKAIAFGILCLHFLSALAYAVGILGLIGAFFIFASNVKSTRADAAALIIACVGMVLYSLIALAMGGVIRMIAALVDQHTRK